jgi:hypothetical protein
MVDRKSTGADAGNRIMSYRKEHVAVYRTFGAPLEGIRTIPQSTFERWDNTLFGAEISVPVEERPVPGDDGFEPSDLVFGVSRGEFGYGEIHRRCPSARTWRVTGRCCASPRDRPGSSSSRWTGATSTEGSE